MINVIMKIDIFPTFTLNTQLKRVFMRKVFGCYHAFFKV